MDKETSLTSKIKEGSPTIFLRGENLEYYRNIEYLKEVTRQANALLDRSNAKYENILDDQKLGYKVRARSTSDSTKSISPEMEGKCRKCGLAHGAANFCIVEKIMDSEKQIEEDKRKSKVSKVSSKSFLSAGLQHLVEEPTTQETPTMRADTENPLKNVQILEKMTGSQVLATCDMLSAKYGTAAGQKFLQVTSIANPSEKSIEKWMTPSETHPKRIPELAKKPLLSYETLTKKCPEEISPKLEQLCPTVSAEVHQKMQQQVSLIPSCQGRRLDGPQKNWRAIFNKRPPKPVEDSMIESIWNGDVEFDSSSFEETCKCNNQTCVCDVDKICTSPKVEKKCVVPNFEEDYENNYLLTVRKKIWKRRETKRTMTRLFSSQTVAAVEKGRTRSDEFLDNAREEQYKTLKECLTNKLQDEEYDYEEFDKKVQRIADMASPHASINPRQWDHWLQQMKEQLMKEEQDDIDSLPSDICTNQDDGSIVSHSTSIDYKPGRIKPSRIPYADDVYDLIDTLYDKITRKFEKSITKNSFKTSRLDFRPTHAFLHRKMALLSSHNPFFNQVMARAKYPSYSKRLTPYRVRKVRKMKRVKVLQRTQVRKDRKRAVVRGLQLGKQYRKVAKSYKYTAESGYVGFSPKERTLLDPKTSTRFTEFNLVDSPLGKAITTKRIHHGFRLISRMFEDAAEGKREDLLDQGMLERLLEFQKKLYNVQQLPAPVIADTDTEDAGQSDPSYQYPPLEDVQLLQQVKNNINHGLKDAPKQMSQGNFPEKERIKAGKSISAERLKKIEYVAHKTSGNNIEKLIQTPYKSTSSTNVKRHKRKSENRKQFDEGLNPEQNLKARSSVKSLTNLLPPLKGQNTKPPGNYEFEETISSLQSELYSLLNQQSRGGKINESDNGIGKKKSSSENSTAVTKLPELKSSRRVTRTSLRRISTEPLPHINQKESVENLQPGRSLEVPPRRLTKKTSMLDILSNKPKTTKLPMLKNDRGPGTCTTEDEQTRKMAKKKTKKVGIPKQSSFKAWR